MSSGRIKFTIETNINSHSQSKIMFTSDNMYIIIDARLIYSNNEMIIPGEINIWNVNTGKLVYTKTNLIIDATDIPIILYNFHDEYQTIKNFFEKID